MATLKQLHDAITVALEHSKVDPSSDVVLVSDPDGQAMEPGTYGIGVSAPGEHGLLTAGIIGNLDAPKEI